MGCLARLIVYRTFPVEAAGGAGIIAQWVGRSLGPLSAHPGRRLSGVANMVAESVESLCQRAREAIESRDWDLARQFYLQALSLKSDSPDVHHGLATVCFQLKDLPSAAFHFKEVTRLDPLRAVAYINLGAIYNLLDQLDEAIPV